MNREKAVEMLAQHIITLPVFEALFGGADFASSNPVSIAMEKMLVVLRKHTLETADEKRELEELYASVRMRAEGIQTDAGRQAVIKELYESFFKEAFKATSEKMGIVYTPNQVVDYILNYVFDLRGNQRTMGEESRKEGGKIFGSGSRAPVIMTILVKNPESIDSGVIHYHDIGDYLTREEKLSQAGISIKGEQFEWDIIHPDRHGDWLDQRDESWYEFAPMGISNKLSDGKNGLFKAYSRGVETDRDVWLYNFDRNYLEKNVKLTIDFYNTERERYALEKSNDKIEDFIAYDTSSISWTRTLRNKAARNTVLNYYNDSYRVAMYRPYCKCPLYVGEGLIDYPGQSFIFFPNETLRKH